MLPKKILVKREVNYHTHYIGKYGNNLAFIGFPFYGGSLQTRPLAVLHLLDSNRSLVSSEIWEREKIDDAELELKKAINRLENATYCDVETTRFSVVLNGLTFGFIAREDGECIKYQPYGLAFFPPWDGYYDT